MKGTCWICNVKVANRRICGGCFFLRYHHNPNMR